MVGWMYDWGYREVKCNKFRRLGSLIRLIFLDRHFTFFKGDLICCTFTLDSIMSIERANIFLKKIK